MKLYGIDITRSEDEENEQAAKISLSHILALGRSGIFVTHDADSKRIIKELPEGSETWFCKDCGRETRSTFENSEWFECPYCGGTLKRISGGKHNYNKTRPYKHGKRY